MKPRAVTALVAFFVVATAACVGASAPVGIVGEGPALDCGDEGACTFAAPYCVDDTCVECRRSTDCAPGELCDDGICGVALCTGDEACDDETKPFCDTAMQRCVECLADPDCTGSDERPICNAGICVECRTDLECPPEEPVCNGVDCTTP